VLLRSNLLDLINLITLVKEQNQKLLTLLPYYNKNILSKNVQNVEVSDTTDDAM